MSIDSQKQIARHSAKRRSYVVFIDSFHQELRNVKVCRGIATECPRRNDNHLDGAINDGDGHSKVISSTLQRIRAYNDHLLGTLNVPCLSTLNA